MSGPRLKSLGFLLRVHGLLLLESTVQHLLFVSIAHMSVSSVALALPEGQVLFCVSWVTFEEYAMIIINNVINVYCLLGTC